MPVPDRTTWLRGDLFHCLQPPTPVGRTWRLVLLGPPGVGKGTQATLLATTLGACPLSTGDIFRAAYQRAATRSGMMEALQRLCRGELVPDDIVMNLVRDRQACLRCPAGFLLDGFPRTLRQAYMLDGVLALNHVHLDAVIEYRLETSELAERLAGCRVCTQCNAPYHVTKRPPRVAGVCDRCGGPVGQRPDDEPAAVQARLAAYLSATAQVAFYYQRQKLLLPVSASGAPEQVLARSLDALAAWGLPVPSTPYLPIAGATGESLPN